MSKEARGDRVVSKLNKRFGRVRARLSKEYKGKNPFRQEPVDNDELLYIYTNMTEEDVGYVLRTYGPEKVNNWMGDMEKIKARRGL